MQNKQVKCGNIAKRELVKKPSNRRTGVDLTQPKQAERVHYQALKKCLSSFEKRVSPTHTTTLNAKYFRPMHTHMFLCQLE